MMERIGVSIVIPTYKRPDLLRTCLVAICNQSYPGCNFEVIVVSDGPDAATESLVAEMTQGASDFIRYKPLQRKSGPAAARNLGWQVAAGELIVFTDDDCIPGSAWLAAYWNAYQRLGLSEVAFTGAVEVPIPTLPTDYEKNVAHLSTAEFITANCACSRSALVATGGFDEDFPTAWREDSELQFKLMEKCIRIVSVQDAQVCHPVRKAGWGVSLAEQRKSMFNALLYKKHPTLYRSRIAQGPVWNYYAIILSTIAVLAGWLLHAPLIVSTALMIWMGSLACFIAKRLRGTSDTFVHRMEMVVTSIFIPYLSVYWTLRGAFRYKTFFL